MLAKNRRARLRRSGQSAASPGRLPAQDPGVPAPIREERTAREALPSQRTAFRERSSRTWALLRFVARAAGRLALAFAELALKPPRLVREVAPGARPQGSWEFDPRAGAGSGGKASIGSLQLWSAAENRRR